ncbi:FG-GAP repeat domain-containing protein [Bacillus safensis]|uniref:FG-GAP repeat domain-containing protein n=1 Tax=Bacillus safensis TaxID=561879 RepID=UPI0036E427A6
MSLNTAMFILINEEIQQVDPESLKNLPIGLDGDDYRWVDLDGEGVSRILTVQGKGWFYKRNYSPINAGNENRDQVGVVQFGPVERVAENPPLANENPYQLMDLNGKGLPDLVQFQEPSPGFYKRTADGRWEPFRTFSTLSVVDWRDPNLKFIDLTGDGYADILMSKDDVFHWYPSCGDEPLEARSKVYNEGKGPRLVFDSYSVYLADMSDDGLTGLVRIRNGEVSYWSNLGYERFGDKVTMDNAPWFDHPEFFDQRLIHLADIDGSGVTDIVYLGREGTSIYFNQFGNSWGQALNFLHCPTSISSLRLLLFISLEK